MKRIILAAILFAGIFCATGNVQAYTINDPIGDQIGTSAFELYGMDIVESGGDLVFDIYTNYPQSGVTVGSWNTFAGDLFFDFDGDSSYDYGIVFTDHEGLTVGGLYSILDFNISNDYAPRGYIYNANKPVAITSGNLLGSADLFLWEDVAGTSPNSRWHIVIDQSYFPHGENIDLFYPVASCANDYLEGSFTVAPEPASMLLFGLGALGAFLRRRFV